MSDNFFGGIIFAAFGLLFLYLALRSGFKARQIRRTWKRTIGIVVDDGHKHTFGSYNSPGSNPLDEGGFSSDTDSYCPTADYQIANGEIVRGTCCVWLSEFKPRPGTRIPIFYNPTFPKEFYVEQSQGCSEIIFLIVGIIFCLIALFAFLAGLIQLIVH